MPGSGGMREGSRFSLALLVQMYLRTGTKVQILTHEELLQAVMAVLCDSQLFACADVCCGVLAYADVR
jgi:hypothetical protein